MNKANCGSEAQPPSEQQEPRTGIKTGIRARWDRSIEQWRQQLWRWRGPILAAPLAAGLVVGVRSIGWLQRLEWLAFDTLIQARPALGNDRRVAIVGIDDQDLERQGKVILPDAVYARAIEILRAQKPRAIGLDVYRDLPIEPGASQLKQVLATTPNLVGVQKVAGKYRFERVAGPPALKARGLVAANDLISDADGKIRRSFIALKDPQTKEDIYSFGLYLALLYLSQERPAVAPEVIDGSQHWRLGKVDVRPFRSNDGGYIHADDRDTQILLNYRGPRQTFERVSLSQVLAGQLPKDWARDRIILIGNISESSKDLFVTPYSGGFLESPEPMPGVEIHANLASQFVAGAIDGRLMIGSWPESIEILWISLWAVVGAALTWALRSSSSKPLGSLWVVLSFGGAIVIVVGSAYGLLIVQGLWIPVAPPLLALAGAAGGISIYLARSASQIRDTFGRYLNAEVVANLLENPEGLRMGGERRRIAILTSDLRGFTATAERLPPEGVIEILNHYLEAMADVITTYGGTIDEFMGDGILVLFGAPTARPDDAKRAIACAVAMQGAMGQVNQKMRSLGFQALEMGIGVNVGDVVVGNIGSLKRTKYGIVGSQVNLTYRVESYTIGGQILITESALEAAGGEAYVHVKGTKQVQPKGVQKPITIYDVVGVAAPYHLTLAIDEEEFCAIAPGLPISYQVLDGKDVGDQQYAAEILELSEHSARLKLLPMDRAADFAAELATTTEPAPISVGASASSETTPANPTSQPGSEPRSRPAGTSTSGQGVYPAYPTPATNLKFQLLATTLPPDIEPTRENLELYAKVVADDLAIGETFTVRFTARSPALVSWFAELYEQASQPGGQQRVNPS